MAVPIPKGVPRATPVRPHPSLGNVFVNLLLAPLRPLADVLDLTAEAVAAVGTVSVAALGLALARYSDHADTSHLTSVESTSLN